MRLRNDDSTPLPLARECLDFAPAFADGFFLVPRLDSHGAAGAAGGEAEE